MPYTLIKGTFHIFYPLSPHSGPEPDGDTIKFQPTNKQLIERLPRANMPAQFNQAGITSIRFEGMDALETHFEVEGDRYNQKIDLALQARDVLLAKMGFGHIEYFPNSFKVSSVENHPIPGCILSNGLDTYGRTIAFVFTGDHPAVDGSSIFVTPQILDSSLNIFMLQQGQAYPAFYLTLPAELRDHLSETVAAARTAGTGVWAQDTANQTSIAHVLDSTVLQQLVMWPKLFRRLAAYFPSNTGLAGFDTWMRADQRNRDDRLILPNRELGNMHDILSVTAGDNIQLKYLPEDVVIVPDDFQLPAPMPVPVPEPQIHAGTVRIIAALINPAHIPETNYESVTLLNTTDAEIDLNGWSIADANGKQALHGSIARGESMRLWLSSAVQLSNKRDTITVLNAEEKIIDQVVYESRNLPAEGYTMVF
jgi:endonuclease YncB( thermonuclease family)